MTVRPLKYVADGMTSRIWSRLFVVLLAIALGLVSGATATGYGKTAELPGSTEATPVTSAAGFTHPGIFVSLDQLEASKEQVEAGEAPWSTIYDQLLSSDAATRGIPDFTLFASANDVSSYCDPDDPAGCVTYCGAYNSPDIGCTEELADARAVYAQALLWWYSGDQEYAQRAIAILNAYTKHFAGHRGSNGPLMAAWTAELMLRGAEIIRYTYTPSSAAGEFDVEGFSTMLNDVFVEKLRSFDFDDLAGNWKLSAADGLINLAVFLDDRALYEEALTMWRERVPSYIYLSSDGRLPVAPNGKHYQSATDLSCWWLNNKDDACKADPMRYPGAVFQNGQAQETCRDLNHTSMGLAGVISVAETAWLQGDDLYAEQQERIIAGVLYAVQISQSYATSGWPDDFCNNVTPLSRNVSLSGLPAEVVFNAYAVRKGISFSAIHIPGYSSADPTGDPLASYIAARRTESNPEHVVNAWETLTHHPVIPSGEHRDDVPPAEHGDGDTASATPVPNVDVNERTSSGTLLGVWIFLFLGLGMSVGIVIAAVRFGRR